MWKPIPAGSASCNASPAAASAGDLNRTISLRVSASVASAMSRRMPPAEIDESCPSLPIRRTLAPLRSASVIIASSPSVGLAGLVDDDQRVGANLVNQSGTGQLPAEAQLF